jgi:hypothetical protein
MKILGRFQSREECSNRGVIRAFPPAFVGNCPRGHCEQEWYKTPPSLKSTSLKSAYFHDLYYLYVKEVPVLSAICLKKSQFHFGSATIHVTQWIRFFH